MPSPSPFTVSPDPRAAGATLSIVETLRAAQTPAADADAPPLNVFKAVDCWRSVRAFQDAADVLTASGPVAGVVADPPERFDPIDNGETDVYRMTVDVLVAFRAVRDAGQADALAVPEMHRLTSLVRRALLRDRSRGGHASTVTVASQLIDGTEVRGRGRLYSDRARDGVYVFTLPVWVGWSEDTNTI